MIEIGGDTTRNRLLKIRQSLSASSVEDLSESYAGILAKMQLVLDCHSYWHNTLQGNSNAISGEGLKESNDCFLTLLYSVS